MAEVHPPVLMPARRVDAAGVHVPLGRVALYAVLAVMAFVFLLPVYVMVVN